MTKQKRPAKIAITGAAGNIGYSLIFKIASGEMLGADHPVILNLIDRDVVRKPLEAAMMELEDCAYPLLADCHTTADLEQGFRDADIAILLGAKPRTAGMERQDLLKVNGETFKKQGCVLNDVASRNVKALVVGNPANTNALIALSNAPDLSPRQFSCLTRLDHNRAIALLAKKLGQPASTIRKMIVWGNHSSTQFPDLLHCEVGGRVVEVDSKWFEEEFIPIVQNRGAQIIDMRGMSSAASAASAVIDHIRDWHNGTRDDDWTSMGILSDGSYGITDNLVFSYPVVINSGKWDIVENIQLSEFEKQLIRRTDAELCAERDAVADLLGKALS